MSNLTASPAKPSAGVLIRDHYPMDSDGESYHISEIDCYRVRLPDGSEGVSVRIIPHHSMNSPVVYGETVVLLSFTDAEKLAQAINSTALLAPVTA